MRFLHTSLAILFAASLLAACSGKDKKEDAITPADKLEGTWEIKRAEGIMGYWMVGVIYEFKGNKVTRREHGNIFSETTLINDSTFTFTSTFQMDGPEMKSMYKYHFNGDTLVVVPPNNVGQVFHMLKK